ncbi:hypothetical protein SAMD00019534_076500 [Acytostelium subglobosum LB1]|uniref:hypothetical protein n=1 Tax=Acytostelium subglobosum LB1 TaxID=1410327 RepID=UPI000644C691|nr:hypothetical protein SAMD00019534_076500 [Acytostelium subglobosum LB1]GAM24475.1 hypothetical protein SAMD00019534_076500 [Acytostelium subglobosum LB1]|eukprot:XP_012752801.1 hypothetical protein SAMD00019534_076500 [Acytostelium subglobosum LB1]
MSSTSTTLGHIQRRMKRWNKNKNKGERRIEVDTNTLKPVVSEEGSTSTVAPSNKPKFLTNWISTTKYTIITFLPKNLFEQFRRVANLYFLVILIISYTPVSPVAPGPSTINLGIVLLINACKEAYEDFRRYQSDKRINSQVTRVVRDGQLIERLWKDLQVGDVVKVQNEEQFPADLVLLSSSSDSPGLCYIETSNLDGETNLKTKQSLIETNALQSQQHFTDCKLLVECEQPSHILHKFDGRISMNSNEPLPLNAEQLLIRGTQLMNTKWVYGIVAYTGHETKYMLNTMATPTKKSKLEREMNRILLMVLFAEIMLCLSSAIVGMFYEKRHGKSVFLHLGHRYGYQAVQKFFTFVVLYSTIVPISLYVTMEIVRVFQIFFINRDKKMYHQDTNQFGMARTSNLNEELGQVEYIFSDKTGTLTRNEMEFKVCSIGGRVFGNEICNNDGDDLPFQQKTGASDIELKEFNRSYGNLAEKVNIDFTVSENLEFFIAMALCHTVIPEQEENGTIKYSSSSPDEIALVNAAATFGIKFNSRTPIAIGIMVNGEEIVYQLLNVIEFSSDRKRMSVIVRDPLTQEIVLYCKGADSSILPHVIETQDKEVLRLSEESLKRFSCTGLRTLCIAKKIIPEAEYEQWNLLYKKASLEIDNRLEKVGLVSQMIEGTWTLMGVTGIEDKLQYNVPSTITTLSKANIKIWMLTGDKQETAINIGISCKLLTGLEILLLNEATTTDLQRTIVSHIQRIQDEKKINPKSEFAVVIDGATLALAITREVEQLFYDLTCLCSSVICCRVTPFQKSEVVRIVKDRTTSITLAIGDGANDVSMIQKAHIGVGVSGKEGRQAVLASDFAIAQFRFLERLVLVHGRYNYKRLCVLICYFFFKNLVCSLLQFWFSTKNQFSGQSLYDGANILGYNLIFTSLPIIVIGVLEKDINSSYLRRFPSLYRECQMGKCFNHRVFWSWIALGIYSSAIIYFFSAVLFGDTPTGRDGRTGGLYQTSAAAFTFMVFIVNLRLCLVINSWTILHHVSIWGSLIVYWFLECLYSYIYIPYTSYFYLIFLDAIREPIFFIALTITVIAALGPAYFVTAVYRNMFTQPLHIAQEIQREEKKDLRQKLQYLRAVNTPC